VPNCSSSSIVRSARMRIPWGRFWSKCRSDKNHPGQKWAVVLSKGSANESPEFVVVVLVPIVGVRSATHSSPCCVFEIEGRYC